MTMIIGAATVQRRSYRRYVHQSPRRFLDKPISVAIRSRQTKRAHMQNDILNATHGLQLLKLGHRPARCRQRMLKIEEPASCHLEFRDVDAKPHTSHGLGHFVRRDIRLPEILQGTEECALGRKPHDQRFVPANHLPNLLLSTRLA